MHLRSEDVARAWREARLSLAWARHEAEVRRALRRLAQSVERRARC